MLHFTPKTAFTQSFGYYLTDISYIRTGQGFLYPSIIRVLYDSSIVAYKTGFEQSINLVLNTIKEAKGREKVTAELQLHSK